jgi:hypothetical protein
LSSIAVVSLSGFVKERLMPKIALGLCSLLFGVGAAHADEVQARFDGVWTTVVSCAMSGGALPYTYEFPSIVRNGVLHGERGVNGVPGWFQLEGRILADGSADISARGLVGKERAAVGERPAGTRYSYQIEARFSDKSGTGHRVKGRTCTVSFSRNVP